jgi:hypothetical protein
MQKKTISLIGVCAALLVAVAVAWLLAQDDDRPPIIVTNGSMYFTNGDASSSITPTQWTDDILLSEWKPADNNYRGITGFAVSFENSYAPTVCASVIPIADDVKIVYTLAGGGTTTYEVKRRKNHLLGAAGKYEPKVTDPGKKLQLTSPTRLEFTDPPTGSAGRSVTPVAGGVTGQAVGATSQGYISKVSVGQTDCGFGPPPTDTARTAFRVRIQPKAQ